MKTNITLGAMTAAVFFVAFYGWAYQGAGI